MDKEPSSPLIRIGELSRRVGLSEHLLRAWESRYGLLRPERSAGRFRLYSAGDEARIRAMKAHLAAGLSAAEAARAVLGEASAPTVRRDTEAIPDTDRLATLRERLGRAGDDLDEAAAQETLDRLLADFTVETVLRDVLVPYLRELGERWARGEVSVAQEHFASNVVRGRLAGLARGWGNGHGPRAMLACPPGELHDIGLMVFGIALRRAGWRVSYLGTDTPVDSLHDTAEQLRPEIVVLSATAHERFAAAASGLSRLAHLCPLAVAGAGASRTVAEQIGARLLTGDPVSAAQALRV